MGVLASSHNPLLHWGSHGPFLPKPVHLSLALSLKVGENLFSAEGIHKVFWKCGVFSFHQEEEKVATNRILWGQLTKKNLNVNCGLNNSIVSMSNSNLIIP